MSNLDTALDYINQLVGQMKYGWWTSGPVPNGAPAYAVNQRYPAVSDLRGQRVFCAGVGNLMRRRVGKTVPTYGNPDFDGGTLAWWTYYEDFRIPFSLRAVKRGDLLLRPFANSSDQGHWALALGDGPGARVLQSFASDGAGNPGLNKTYTVEESHDGFYYKALVRAYDWINHDRSVAGWAE